MNLLAYRRKDQRIKQVVLHPKFFDFLCNCKLFHNEQFIKEEDKNQNVSDQQN